MTSIPWYSLSPDLKAVDHAPVPLPQAVEIARKYYSNASKKYQQGEEAVADTMFGFMRDKKIFVEFCINGPSSVFCRFEMPQNPGKKESWLDFLFNGIVQHQFTLVSFDELARVITDFYLLDPAAFRDKIQTDMAA